MTVSVRVRAPLRQEPLHNEHTKNITRQGLKCYIHTSHPLAFCLIKEAVCGYSHSNVGIEKYSIGCTPVHNNTSQVLIIDVCSVPDWVACFEEWQNGGGAVIALASSEPHNMDAQVQMLHLGAAAILTFNDSLTEQLPKALHAIVEGHSWIKREVLNHYLARTRTAIYNLSLFDRGLTAREKEILDLLRQNFANRIIARKLAISERTIKFHVTNILRKLNLTKRRDLAFLDSSRACLSDIATLSCISPGYQRPVLKSGPEEAFSY
jgi:DNA-binding NarL/FixJ family response regulator